MGQLSPPLNGRPLPSPPPAAPPPLEPWASLRVFPRSMAAPAAPSFPGSEVGGGSQITISFNWSRFVDMAMICQLDLRLDWMIGIHEHHVDVFMISQINWILDFNRLENMPKKINNHHHSSTASARFIANFRWYDPDEKSTICKVIKIGRGYEYAQLNI